jgi:hypothetical protein
MKAEQRKELETNALADRMGHMMTRVKAQPRRTAMYWVIGIAVLFIALFLLFRLYITSRENNSLYWKLLENGNRGSIDGLVKEFPLTTQGKAARFEQAWIFYWEAGIKRLGIEREKALDAMDFSAKLYRDLAKDCEDDPIWESEALFALAVIEETHAVQDIEALDKAKLKYEAVVAKHKETARGKLAQEWLDDYGDSTKKLALKAFYQEMHTTLNIPDFMPRKGLEDFLKAKKNNAAKPK